MITANVVLENTIERIHVGKQYGDIPRGVFIVRGENVVLLGEIVSCFVEVATVSRIIFGNSYANSFGTKVVWWHLSDSNFFYSELWRNTIARDHFHFETQSNIRMNISESFIDGTSPSTWGLNCY